MNEENPASKWVKVNDGDVPYYYCTDDVDESDGESGCETVYVLDLVDEDSAADDGRHNENGLSVHEVTELLRDGGEIIYEADEKESSLDVNNQDCASGSSLERTTGSDNTPAIVNSIEHATVDGGVDHHPNKLFRCLVCGKYFLKQSELHRHSRIHSGSKPYRCHVCGKQFTLNSNLKTHLRTHSGTRPYKCVYCSESFTYLHSLQRHARVHNDGNFFECRDCNRKFVSGKLLEAHLLSHVKLRSIDDSQEQLNQEGVELNRDGNSSKKEEIQLPAAEASKNEDTGDDLLPPAATEQSASENSINPYSSGAGILKEDTRLINTKTENCEDDKESNHAFLGSDLHERCKMANGFFKCPKCEKVTGRKWEFYRHYRKHLGLRPFQCHFCSKTFTVRCNLNTHLRLHTGVKPYHCTQCNERFMYLHSLQRHIRVHNNGKFLECEKCNRKFTNITEFKAHSQLHTETVDITIEFDDINTAITDNIPLENIKTYTQEQSSRVEVTPPSITEIEKDSQNTKISTDQKTTETADNKNQLIVNEKNEENQVTQRDLSDGKINDSTTIQNDLTKSDAMEVTEHRPVSNDVDSSSAPAQGNHREEQSQPSLHIQAFPRFPNYIDKQYNPVHNPEQTYLLHNSKFSEHQVIKKTNLSQQHPNHWRSGPFNTAVEHYGEAARRSSIEMTGKFDHMVSSNTTQSSPVSSSKSITAPSGSDVAPVFILDDEQNIREEVKPKLEEGDIHGFNGLYFDDQDDLIYSVKEEDDKESLIRLKENFLRSVKIENGCFVCQLCGKELWRKSEMQKHLRIHFNIKPFVCIYCSKSFTLNCNLKAHLRLHTGSLPYKCQECGQRFMYIHSLQRHARIHNNGKFFECIDCNRRFTGAKEHIEHMMSHKIAVPNVVKMEETHQSTASSVHNHINITNIDNEREQSSKENHNAAKGHVFITQPEGLHGITGPHLNAQFGDHFERKLFNLQGQKGEENDMYKKNPAAVIGNDVTIKEEEDFKPNVFKPIYPGYYNDRMKFLGEGTGQPLDKPYVCTVCSKRFTVKCNLKTHMRLHSGDKPYACSVCGERFMYLHSLQRHVRVHNSGKFLECRDCNRRFISKEELARHEAMHELGHTYQSRFPYVRNIENNADMQIISPRYDGVYNFEQSHRSKFPYMVKSEPGTQHNVEPGYYPDIINVDYARFKSVSTKEDAVNKGQFYNTYPNINHQFIPNTEYSKRLSNSYSSAVLHKENIAVNVRNGMNESSQENGQLNTIESPSDLKQDDRHIDKSKEPQARVPVPQVDQNTVEKQVLTTSPHGDYHEKRSDMCKDSGLAMQNVLETNRPQLPGFSKANPSLDTYESGRIPVTNGTYASFDKSHEELYDIRGQKKEFQCPHCDRILTRKWDFDRHIRKHSGDKPFNCEFCGKSFGLNSSLKAHTRIHTNEQPYSCEECGLTFTYLHSLQRHVRVHNNGNFLECTECNRRFTTKADYIMHMRCQHTAHIIQGSSLQEDTAGNHQSLEPSENLYVCHVSS